MFILSSFNSALSAFRTKRLLSQLQLIDSAIINIKTHYFYLIDTSNILLQQDKQRLSNLLACCTSFPILEQENIDFIVLPRFGMTSPWSSKAIDIIHNCGINEICRIERGIAYYIQVKSNIFNYAKFNDNTRKLIIKLLHDRMTETVLSNIQDTTNIFLQFNKPQPTIDIDLLTYGKTILKHFNTTLGLALTKNEINYLFDKFINFQRNPTDVELMMFAQVNSEHCRHKIFNAEWIINDKKQAKSLFDMIRYTHTISPRGTIIAYNDNSAVIHGAIISCFYQGGENKNNIYEKLDELTHILIKVETHNHPTAISPFYGALTGVGGEIRDESATGRGAKQKAGLTGFTVSNLMLACAIQPWENMRDVTEPFKKRNIYKSFNIYGKPDRIASPLQIVIDGSLGSAAFNNEFGRPNLGGYFRTYEQNVGGIIMGYHKPIMIVGGIGNISYKHIKKNDLPVGSLLIQLGGPGMRIGIGGSTASSMISGTNSADLDFNSVQRGNPEMQRRAQEVINACCAMGDKNPILSIHDVGAGGLSNASAEIVNIAKRGAIFNLHQILVEECGLTPKETWTNESQERYVLAIARINLPLLQFLCERERCLFSIIGVVTTECQLKLLDTKKNINLIDIPVNILFNNLPKIKINVRRIPQIFSSIDLTGLDLLTVSHHILSLPVVADKSFLITISDRSVGAMTIRDQMVGPWQVPVADCAVTSMSLEGYLGEAMSMGERTPLAVINPAASGRIAIGEAITNISAASIHVLSDIKLSANWMAACGQSGQDVALFDMVKAVCMELCPKLGISIPVGKDSLSMCTTWECNNLTKTVISPVSLIVSAFAFVQDIRYTLTPQIRKDLGETVLIVIDLGRGKNRIGASALAQVIQQIGNFTPDVDSADDLKNFFYAIQKLNRDGKLLAYHDRSDGGLFITLVEMAFAGHCGLSINLDMLTTKNKQFASDLDYPKNWTIQEITELYNQLILRSLFNEELGAVIQIYHTEESIVMNILRDYNLSTCSHVIGKPNNSDIIEFIHNTKKIYSQPRSALHRIWSETSWRISRLRDNPVCADAEYEHLLDILNPGITPKLTFDIQENIVAFFINSGVRPRVAILREQGVNSHIETAYVMYKSGFEVVDVHMSDLIMNRIKLDNFIGLIVVGGFSYGDVFGAGEGWAKTILFNTRLVEQFSRFFQRSDTFSLGICNGCQMMSNLKSIIPGAEAWPKFIRNKSEKFEARFVMVEIQISPSIFLQDMAKTQIPITVAHSEGFADFSITGDINKVLVTMRFVDNYGHVTEIYPYNPNGSPQGITGVSTPDGRFNILMPHAERVFRTVTHSWHPDSWNEDGPWMRMFYNARKWVG